MVVVVVVEAEMDIMMTFSQSPAREVMMMVEVMDIMMTFSQSRARRRKEEVDHHPTLPRHLEEEEEEKEEEA